MTDGGYGFHPVWVNLPEWITQLDVDAVRREAGIAPPTVQGETKPGTAP